MSPTVIFISGWRLFFYSNEGDEPIHVHAEKGEAACKFWIRREEFDIEEAWSHDLTPRLRREIRKIVFDHFDQIVSSWHGFFGASSHESD